MLVKARVVPHLRELGRIDHTVADMMSVAYRGFDPPDYFRKRQPVDRTAGYEDPPRVQCLLWDPLPCVSHGTRYAVQSI